MLVDDAYDKVFELLDKDCLDVSMVSLYKQQAPVNPLALPNVNMKHAICLSEKIIEDLYNIQLYTRQTNYEVPFFLFGEERNDGSVYFDRIIYYKNQQRSNANFLPLRAHLLSFIDEVQKNKLTRRVVCHGHTHGMGVYADNFSLDDMVAYVIMSESHNLMKKGIIQTIGCVFNSSGDFNFVLYDKHNNGFYKFPNVFIEYDNGEKDYLPAYIKGVYNGTKYR